LQYVKSIGSHAPHALPLILALLMCAALCLTLLHRQAPDKGLPAPDVVIYLDLPVEKAMERGQFGEERYTLQNTAIRVLLSTI
jgi:thymidylate kinase